MVTADRRELLHPRPHPPAHLPRSSIRPYGPMITAGWGHFRPSQPPRRVDRWAQLKPSRRHLTDSQVGPPRAVTLGPDQAVTARRRIQPFTAEEVGEDDKAAVLRAYLRRWRWAVRSFFGGNGPNASDAELRAEGRRHPVVCETTMARVGRDEV